MPQLPQDHGANTFYNDRRWGPADAIAAVLIAVPALVVAFIWYMWFIRARPARRDPVPMTLS